MEFVKEMKEPQIVEQENVLMLLPQIIQMLFVMPTKRVVSLTGRVVLNLKAPVLVIPVLPLVVVDILDQMDIVKEQMTLQTHHVPQKYVPRLPRL